MNKPWFDRLRKIFAVGKVAIPDEKEPQVKTRAGTIVKVPVRWPYGFSAYPEEGTVIVCFEGGDQGAPTVLYISNQDGAPSLEKGEAALWCKAGAAVVAKASGKLDIRSKEQSLKALLEELIGFIAKIKTTGGYTLTPDLLAELETSVKPKVSQLLEE